MKMKKHEKSLLFYTLMDNIIPFWDHDLHEKMEFSKNFMNNMTIKNLENKRISIGPMNEKTLQFLIFSILLEFGSVKEPEKPKRLEKDLFYLDTKEIFPREEMTVEDVTFIEHCLDQLHVDLESDDDKEFVLSTNHLIFLLRGIMKQYDTFLSNGKKFEE